MRRHLVFDLLGGVGEEDGGVCVTGTHLGLGPLQCGEEGGMQQGRFGVANPGGHVTGHPEVGVLVAGKTGLALVLLIHVGVASDVAVVYNKGHLSHGSLTWSMAQGMRHCTSFRPLKICGKELLKEGAAWMAGKLIFPLKENTNGFHE